MVSSVGYAKPLSRIAKPILLPASVAALAYGLYYGRTDAIAYATRFFTGPGSKSRILALCLVMINWKSLPLAWTVRIFNTMIGHIFVRPLHTHPPSALFHPVISQSHVTLLEVDYNVHKSNSTYFADLDISRSHLASHLFARGIRRLANNEREGLVVDPSSPDGRPARGRFGVSLGAVACCFKREIKPYQRYETWTRVLSWDRKWLYLVTHFVEAGAVKPRSWDSGNDYGALRGDGGKEGEDWQKKIYATAVSKYVWKMGRLTVHPAIVIGSSGLLPERPGGWLTVSEANSPILTDATSTPEEMADPAEPVTGNTDAEAKEFEEETGWDWRKTERERVKGMEFAKHFAALDGLAGEFDGGNEGVLGRFALG